MEALRSETTEWLLAPHMSWRPTAPFDERRATRTMAALTAMIDRRLDPLQRVSHAVAPVRLGGPNFHGDGVKERERGDLDPRDDHGHPCRGSVPERDQGGGDENGEEA